MIVDGSAIVAILNEEPGYEVYVGAIAKAPVCRMSAASWFEASILIDKRRNPIVSRRFDQFVVDADILVESFTEEQAKIARQAYRDFGKGSGHPAQLNFGDCFAYALAKVTCEPLLFKGNDFNKTDIVPAV